MNPQNPYEQSPTQPQGPQPVQGGYPPYPGQPNVPQPEPVAPTQFNPLPTPRYDPAQVPGPQPASPAQPYVAPPQQYQQQQPATDFPVDYLNNISPTVKPQQSHKFAIIALIGGILMAVFAVVFMILNASGPDFSEQTKTIQVRINTLATVTAAQQNHLKENDVTQTNATLNSTLTTMNTDLTALMKERGINVTKDANKTLTASEKTYNATLAKKLDDSYQRGTLDRTYATQMTYELTLLRSKLNKLKNTSNSKSVDAFCDSSITNIDVTLKALADFDATK